METSFRARLIKIVTFVAGIYFFLEFVLPEAVVTELKIDRFHENISNGFIVVGFMAFGLGIINLFMVHGSRVIFRREGWSNSLSLLLGMIIMATVIGFDWAGNVGVQTKSNQLSVLADFARRIKDDAEKNVSGVLPVTERKELLLTAVREEVSAVVKESKEISYPDKEETRVSELLLELDLTVKAIETQSANLPKSSVGDKDLEFAKELGTLAVIRGDLLRINYKSSTTNKLWIFLFEGLFVSLGSAMFSLLGIYVASAAYRAFRLKSLEASFMMAAAVIVMLGQIPFGLWIYEGLPEIRLWLLEKPNAAAFRAISIGASIGALVMAFRMWLSIESDYSEDSA